MIETLATARVSFFLWSHPAVEADEIATGELAWLRGEMARALVRPRTFARSLAYEHFGLAGLVVVLACGFAFSLAVDSAVLTSKSRPPLEFAGRILADAGLLAVRLAVVVSLVATAVYAAVRIVARHAACTLDQLFTAITFALIPLLIAPAIAPIVGVFPEAAPAVGVVGIALVARIVYALALNLAAILRPAAAALATVLVVFGAALALGDQIARVEFTALAYVPSLAPPLAAAPAEGRLEEGDTWSLRLPAEWRNETKGIRGEAARFETDRDSLVVTRVTGSAFLTANTYADEVASVQGRGIEGARTERSVRRVGGLIVVDEVVRGTYSGRPVTLRLFTTVTSQQALALVFRFVDPSDEAAELAQAASIAATWRVR